jgi:hypothetical protein
LGLHLLAAYHHFKDLPKDSSMTCDKSAETRIICYCIAKGGDNLFPDLQAAHSGLETKFDIFYDFASLEIDAISGATPNRHGEHRVLQAGMAKELFSS